MNYVMRIILAVAAMTALSGTACAQADYPNRPLRLVVPFGPGGSADLVARVIAQKLGDQMGHFVVVDNRPGANMNIGAELVAKAQADGYTALYNTSNMIFNIFMYRHLNYDAVKDFAPVALTAAVPQILLVNRAVPATNLIEFIAHVRANPGKLNYASVGIGAISHLTTLIFLNTNKLTAIHIPYRGSGQAYVDLLGGRTQFYFGTVASAVPFVKDGRLRTIAVTSLERSKALPDVPTFSESGMPKFEATSWQGVLVPAKTPIAVINRLNAEILKVLKHPDVQRQLDVYGVMTLGSTPKEYSSYMKSEHQRWGKIIRDQNITRE